MFDHFLITRFNLKKSDWGTDKNNHRVLDESWLRDRVQLFEKYCFPSVQQQTNLNFKWLIFFEKDTYPVLNQLIDHLNENSFIEPVFINGYQEFQKGLPGFIKQRMNKDSNFVITTRLDNDDALNLKFIEALQEAMKQPVHNKVVHFPNGLVLDIAKKNRLASVEYPFNQFVSLVEKRGNEDLKTVFSREHDKWDILPDIHTLNLKDAWLQVTHSKNMVNSFKGSPAFSKRLGSFGIKQVNFNWDYDLKIMYSIYRRKIKKSWTGGL